MSRSDTLISAVEKCYILYKITYFQVIVIQTKWKKLHNEGEFEVTLDAAFISVSKELSHFRMGMVGNPWICFLRTPSSSEKRLLAAWWTLRGKLELYVTVIIWLLSAFVLDHKMSFFIRCSLVTMVWEDVLNLSSLYPFLCSIIVGEKVGRWFKWWMGGWVGCFCIEIITYDVTSWSDGPHLSNQTKQHCSLTKNSSQSPLAEIRPLMKAKRKKVSRPPAKITPCLTLDNFLE